MQKVYGFTNEFVAAYPSIYNFDNANVLSVIGSGDQYFIALLSGAKDITVFDINKNAWFHFVLKFMCIKHLSYEEFCQFFFYDNLNNIGVYLKVRDYLPADVKKFFDILRIMRTKFSNIKISNTLTSKLKLEDFEKILPYLKEETYYKLQELLHRVDLPKCIINDFSVIALDDSEKPYDMAVLSNIYDWMDLPPVVFKLLLDRFDSCVMQAQYFWYSSDEIKTFEELGFESTCIPSIKSTYFNDENNYVLTYKRTK